MPVDHGDNGLRLPVELLGIDHGAGTRAKVYYEPVHATFTEYTVRNKASCISIRCAIGLYVSVHEHTL